MEKIRIVSEKTLINNAKKYLSKNLGKSWKELKKDVLSSVEYGCSGIEYGNVSLFYTDNKNFRNSLKIEKRPGNGFYLVVTQKSFPKYYRI